MQRARDAIGRVFQRLEPNHNNMPGRTWKPNEHTELGYVLAQLRRNNLKHVETANHSS
jgi:hypothetical protein